jgi:hypothetical protein
MATALSSLRLKYQEIIQNVFAGLHVKEKK